MLLLSWKALLKQRHAQEERDIEWSRLEEMGIKLDNEALTKEENDEFKDLLIDNKDVFATDIS